MAPKRKTSRRAPVRRSRPTPTMTAYSRMPQQSPVNTILLVLVILFGVFSLYLFSEVSKLKQAGVAGTPQAQQQAPPTVNVTLDKVKALFKDGFIHFGDANRRVLFVEVTDPSCPFCHIAGGHNPELSSQANFKYVSAGGTYTPPVPEMKKLVDAGKASMVFLYGTGHGAGKLAAEALYCAHEKGKFWEVHDKFMSNEGYTLINEKVKNDRANAPALVSFVSDVIDPTFLTQCLQSAKYEKTLTRDEQIDPTLGFQGTPHFLVNTAQFGGAQDYTKIEPAVTSALK